MTEQSLAHEDHHHDSDEELAHHYDTNRIEAFSDGVFSIAITLLVLEIAVPHVSDGSLAHGIGKEWPSLFGFFLSFISIGIMWMNHHALFRDIERFNHVLLVLNLFLLLSISFLPFPTAVIAENLLNDDQRLTATLFYGATLTMNAVCFNALWLYASTGRRLIDRHVSDRRVSSRTRRYIFGPLLYGLGLPLAFISPWITLWLYVALAIFFFIPPNE